MLFALESHLYSVKPCHPLTPSVTSLSAPSASPSSSAASWTISKTTGAQSAPSDVAPVGPNGGKNREPGADGSNALPESLTDTLAVAPAAADAARPAAQSSPGAGNGLPRGVPKRPPTPLAHFSAALRAGDEEGGGDIWLLWSLLLLGDHSRAPVFGSIAAAPDGRCEVGVAVVVEGWEEGDEVASSRILGVVPPEGRVSCSAGNADAMGAENGHATSADSSAAAVW